MRVSADTPFCIAILGDFSGREHRGTSAVGAHLAQRTPLQIDRDTFDDVMKKLDVRLNKVELPLASSPVDMHFQGMDDFHPDQLFEKLEIFSALRSLRQRLLDADTFDNAAQEVLAWGAEASNPPSEQPVPRQTEEATDTTSVHDLFENILEESNAPESVSKGSFNWSRIIQDIVAPYATNESIPRQSEMVSCVDNAAQALMSDLLHSPSFTAVESVWRSLQFLIARTETSSSLKVYLLDISRNELEDLLAASSGSDTALQHVTALQQVLVSYSEESLDAPWGLLVGNYEFDVNETDVGLLEKIAQVAVACGAPFIGNLANKSILHSAEDAQDSGLNVTEFNSQIWTVLRQQPESAYVGLAWPRFLLRTPYGIASQPIDAFSYEEISDPEVNAHLLWGNSAFLCATLVAESFSRSGWHMQPNEIFEIENLPTWIYDQSGESQIRAGGEFLLTESELVHLRATGAIAVATIRDQDIVRVSDMQSLHQSMLLGHWISQRER